MIYEQTSLDVVAARMRLFAKDNPYARAMNIQPYRRQLSRGLEITFLCDDQGWYLEIARVGVDPSEQEEQIIKRFFAVPANAARDVRSNALMQSKQTRNAIRWRWASEFQGDG